MTRYGFGRGSNPASRKNLTGPVRDTYVHQRGTDGPWRAIEGPMTFGQAYAKAQRLNELHAGRQEYVASRSVG